MLVRLEVGGTVAPYASMRSWSSLSLIDAEISKFGREY